MLLYPHQTCTQRVFRLISEMRARRKIDNTLLYVQIADTIFKDMTDEFTVRIARTPKEVQSLLKVGFEHVCEKDGRLYFRKRK